MPAAKMTSQSSTHLRQRREVTRLLSMSASQPQSPVSRDDVERLSREIADVQTRLARLQADVDLIREIVTRLAKTGF
jgi:hypothetical protein